MNNPFGGELTTAQFQDALAKQIDASKPDPLAKRQIEELQLSWKQCGGDGKDTAATGGGGQSLHGTFSLSSEFISILIHVTCKYRENCSGSEIGDGNTDNTGAEEESRCFENVFYFQLTASAKLVVPVGDHNSSEMDRKESKMKRKLHAGMVKRLQSNALIRRLLVTDEKESGDGNKNDLPLCEALIQQNRKPYCELEERVNVHEDSLEGIRNAIFSHAEDNLDVLEIILNMPYLPRTSSSSAGASDACTSSLAGRAYLRMLEDAMVDACEKDGEDNDLLDNLDISSGANSDGNDGGGKSKRTKDPNKKMKP